jgi:hypothetical protein
MFETSDYVLRVLHVLCLIVSQYAIWVMAGVLPSPF